MEQPNRYRTRITYTKCSTLIFTSHRSLIDVLMRAIRRTQIPLHFTEGFSPRPKVIFSPPLPLGALGEAELIDIETTQYIEEEDLMESLNRKVPEGLKFTQVTNLLKRAPALGQMIGRATYVLSPFEKLSKSEASRMLDTREIIITKKAKKGKPPKDVDVRPYIYSLIEKNDGSVIAEIAAGEKTVSPLILASLLWPELPSNVLEHVQITRRGFISPAGIKLY
jgi:radical SAM-linked protein